MAVGFEPLVLLGRASEERAELLVIDRSGKARGEGVRIEGRLTGPDCRRANMLPTVIRLEPLATPAGGVAMAGAVLTEPAYWHPEVPARYRLQARLILAGCEVASCDRWVGMRRSGVRGRSLWLEGRRFVPRGVGLEAVPEAGVGDLRMLGATAWIPDPDAASCARAAAEGIVVIARVTLPPVPAAGAALGERLTDLGGCPAVLLAVVPAAAPDGLVGDALALAGRRRGTLLVAQEVDATRPPPPDPLPPVDCLVALLPRGSVPHAGWRLPPPVPVVAAWEPGGEPLPPAVARADCDRLQALLAGWGQEGSARPAWDWAGYLVR
ncbi:MAG: hypothetical protein EBR86_11445 [Planctomycetia bacterium]|nr:hypothetical protein [Planctomycetia bacterium]